MLMHIIQSAETDLNALCTYRCVNEIQEYLLNLKDPAVIQMKKYVLNNETLMTFIKASHVLYKIHNRMKGNQLQLFMNIRSVSDYITEGSQFLKEALFNCCIVTLFKTKVILAALDWQLCYHID